MARTTPVNSGYTIIQGVTRGTNVSEVDSWIEYKVLSQSIETNSSQVRAILYSQARRPADTRQENTPRKYGYVQIDDGTKYWLTTTFNYQNNAICKFADHTFTVVHNVNGTKTITISGDFDFSEYVGKYLTGGSASGTVVLPTIPQYATISQSVQSKTETSITITWVSDSIIDYVWYSIDNGSTWVSVGSTKANTGSYTVTGLTANTAYNIKTRIRNKSSQLTTDSSALAVSTYSYPYASAMPNFILGDNVTITFFNPLGRTFSFSIIGADNTEITYPSWSINGTSYTGLSNMSSTVPALYATIPSAKKGTYKIKTTYGTNIITKTGGEYSVREADCKPSISALTYADVNSTSTAITQNNQHIVQTHSIVQYTATGVIGNMSATITSVQVVVNNQTYTLSKSGNDYIGGNASIDSGQNVTAVCTITDSRGFTKTSSVTVQMYAWEIPSAIITLGRHSNFYSETDITVDASYSSIDNKNTITIQYRKKKVNTSTWSTYASLSDNVLTTFTADNEYQWNIQVKLTDAFGGTVTYNLLLARGMPLIYFDRIRNSVGINCFPQADETLYLNGYDMGRYEGTVTLSSGWELYDSSAPIVLRRQGNVVYLRGVIAPSQEYTLGATAVQVGQIDDSAFYPDELVYQLCQGSDRSMWFLQVNSAGKIFASRHRDSNGTSYTTVSSTSYRWFPFSITWIK